MDTDRKNLNGKTKHEDAIKRGINYRWQYFVRDQHIIKMPCGTIKHPKIRIKIIIYYAVNNIVIDAQSCSTR